MLAGSTERVYVTLSHKIAGLGLLERENAAVLNAATMPLAERIVPAFQKALAALGVTKARVYFPGMTGVWCRRRKPSRWMPC